jgi:hypothetical protein
MVSCKLQLQHYKRWPMSDQEKWCEFRGHMARTKDMVRCNRVLVFVNGVPVSSHDLPLLSYSKLSLAMYEPCLFSVQSSTTPLLPILLSRLKTQRLFSCKDELYQNTISQRHKDATSEVAVAWHIFLFFFSFSI